MVQTSAMESYDVRRASSPLTMVAPPEGAERQLLARGGMADVFLAGDGDDVVVLKRVRDDLDDPRLVGMLIAEAELTESLRHPNVVRCHGLTWEADGQPTMAMEYVAGLDLEALLRACSKRRLVLPMSHRLAVVCGVLRALDYAHRSRDERGIPFEVVHRDISPSNVLVGFAGEVKLCDFGIATSTKMPKVLTERVEGKASYMSPEHARGEPLDARSDVFAAGILLWELVAGRRMRRRQDGARIDQARAGTVPTLPKRGIAGEAALTAIVERALAFDPADRYATAGLLMRDLERWCRRHAMTVGESELARFMRVHFAEEQGAVTPRTLPSPPAGAAPPAAKPDVVMEEAPSMPTRAPRPWWRDLPILVAAAAVTFVLMSALV